MPDDDLSKWRVGHWIPVYESNPGEDIWQHYVWAEKSTSRSVTIGMCDRDMAGEDTVVQSLSLDDAENFATLILYEVQRAKGEL